MPFTAFAESPSADSGAGGLVCLLFALVVAVLVVLGRRRPTARRDQVPAPSVAEPSVAETAKEPPADLEREKDEKIRRVLGARAGKEPATVLAQIEKIEDEYRRKK